MLFWLFVGLVVSRVSRDGPEAAAQRDRRDLVVTMWKRNLQIFQTTEVVLTHGQSFLVLLLSE
jgi:hypothetical protein